MTDALGWRMKFGCIGPSTNTIVQPDFDDLRIPGVTNHYSRILVQDLDVVSNETFMAGTKKISEAVLDAVDSAMTCSPGYLVMGMSAVTFYDGVEGAKAFGKKVAERAGIGVSTGAHSVAAALNTYGVKKVAFLSPYFPVANAEVRRFLEESGFEVVRDTCLQCPSFTAIAHEPEEKLRGVVKELDGDDVEAIIQVGTNLSMMRLAGEAERWLGKPVIAINAATYWHALRTNGIEDKVMGFGSLLERY